MTAATAVRDGGSAPVAVLMAVTGRAPAAARAAAAWLADLTDQDRLVVAVPAGRVRLRQSLDEALVAPVGAAGAVAGDPRLRVVAVPGGRTAILLWRSGAAALGGEAALGGAAGSSGAVASGRASGSGRASDEVAGEAIAGAGAVILADGTGRVTPGTVAGLCRALAVGARVAGVPALATDDSLAHAGHAPAGPGCEPWSMLVGQPPEDLTERAPALVVPMIATAPLALRPDDLALLDGIAAPGPGSVCAAITAALGGAVLVIGAGPAAEPPVVRRATREGWDRAGDGVGPASGAGSGGGGEPGDPGPWPDLPAWAGPPLDLPVAGLRVMPAPAGPVIERREPTTAIPASTGAASAAHRRRSRWAIVVASPAGPGGLAWGDTHFAADLAAALRRHGQQVAVVRRPAAETSARTLDDVVVVLRGLVRVRPVPGPTSVLWVISHPDLVDPDEPGEFDVVCAASTGWARRASSRLGVAVHPLLQATDPTRFHPDLADSDSGDRVLFVGNSRRQERPVVRDVLAAGADLAVYGSGWDALPPGVVRAPFLPPDRVGAAYRGAGIVLNDHWPDMAREGFLSNRLFDAVAAGARVVSDDAEGLRDVFGAAVRVVHGPGDVAAVLTMDPEDIVGDDTARRAAAARIAAEHSFDARAATLIDLVNRVGG